MKPKSARNSLFSLLMGVVLVACGSGGGGGNNNSSGNPGGGNNPPAPALAGFALSLQEGDFWEFQWDYEETEFAQPNPATVVASDKSRFRITLGPPITIDGITFYEIQLSGRSLDPGSSNFARWRYVAVANNQILGSEDGVTSTVLFDAQTGSWAGSGVFTTFPSDKLLVAQGGFIDNDYVSSPAVQVTVSANKNLCQVIGGISFCGDDSFTYIEREYYQENIGPLGYFYNNSFSSCGGGFCSGGSTIKNIGLAASSLKGDSVDYDLEAEPNNAPASPQIVGVPDTVVGDVERNDPGTVDVQVASTVDNPDQRLADWYQFTLTTQQNVTIGLTYADATSNVVSDLDLYLSDANKNIVGQSLGDNAASDDPSETITMALPLGTYRIMVHAWATPSGRVEYTLETSTP